MEEAVLNEDLDRRSFVGAGLAVAGVSAVPLPAFAAVRQAVPAKKFYDLVGICTHPERTGTIWQGTDWEPIFLEAGVRNTRGMVGSGATGQAALANLRPLFDKGVKICATVAEGGLDRTATKANVDFLATTIGAQNISGIESANEYSNPSTRPADWVTRLREFHKWLYTLVRSKPALANVPVIGPSIWGRLTQDYIALGNLEPYIDRACLHWYTGGRRPSIAGMAGRPADFTYTMADAIREAKILAPTKPLWITEYGHPIAGPGTPLSNFTITEKAAARYIPRGLLGAFALGVERMNVYALIDDVHRDPPRYHGLLDGALQRRLTFFAVKNLMALFRDTGTLSSPGSLDYTLGNLTASIKRQLFQKSDRTFLLTMYQDVDSYDTAAKRDTDVPLILVRLNLAATASKIELFTPSSGPAAVQSVTNSKTLSIPVGDQVSVVKITLATTATASAQTTTSTSAARRDPFEFAIPPDE